MSHRAAWIPTLLFGVVASCNTEFKDDEVRYNEVDRLRVLAIRSDPADVVAGDTATLSALVYEPDGRTVSYAWSWCPAPGKAEQGFECLVSEQQARDAWATLDTGTELAPFSLGTDETAQLPVAFDKDLLSAWCKALFAAGERRESLTLACVLGLEPRIQLTVVTDEEELVAIRSLPVGGSTDPTARNQHPAFNGEVRVRTDDGDRELAPGEPFRPDVGYKIRVGVDEDQAERTEEGDRKS